MYYCRACGENLWVKCFLSMYIHRALPGSPPRYRTCCTPSLRIVLGRFTTRNGNNTNLALVGNCIPHIYPLTFTPRGHQNPMARGPTSGLHRASHGSRDHNGCGRLKVSQKVSQPIICRGFFLISVRVSYCTFKRPQPNLCHF